MTQPRMCGMIVLHILLRCLGTTLLVCHVTESVTLSKMLVIELMGVTSLLRMRLNSLGAPILLFFVIIECFVM
jgi:hypothetical protein